MQVLFWITLAALALAVGPIAAFCLWRHRVLRRLLGASTIVQTPRGPVDCAFAGPEQAPPVLVLHGGLGGWDQGLALAQDLDLVSRFRVIAPSRSGYLRTPVAGGRTIENAAASMIGLLDALEIPTAFVVGISGGGPTAVAMAIHHPQRVRALLMVCAISHHHVQPGITTETLFGRLLFSSLGGWLLDMGSWSAWQAARIAPAFMARYVLQMTELNSRGRIRQRVRELRQNPRRLRWLSRLLESCFPISPRRIGLANDLAVFASLGQRIEGRIHCPTLVVHGRIDGNVPVAHAEAVLTAADQGEPLIIDDGSHLLWLHARIDEVRARVLHFLGS